MTTAQMLFMCGVEVTAVLVAFIFAKFIQPVIPPDTIETVMNKTEMLNNYATQFVRMARQFMNSKSGEEKMAFVVEQLGKIAERIELPVDKNDITAIAQAAYEVMKSDTTQNIYNTLKTINGIDRSNRNNDVLDYVVKAVHGDNIQETTQTTVENTPTDKKE